MLSTLLTFVWNLSSVRSTPTMASTFSRGCRHATYNSRSLVSSQWAAASRGGAANATSMIASAISTMYIPGFSCRRSNALALQKVPGTEGGSDRADRTSWDTVAMSMFIAVATTCAITRINKETDMEAARLATSVSTVSDHPLVSSASAGGDLGKLQIRGNILRRLSSFQNGKAVIELPKEASRSLPMVHFRHSASAEYEGEVKDKEMMDVLAWGQPYEVSR